MRPEVNPLDQPAAMPIKTVETPSMKPRNLARFFGAPVASDMVSYTPERLRLRRSLNARMTDSATACPAKPLRRSQVQRLTSAEGYVDVGGNGYALIGMRVIGLPTPPRPWSSPCMNWNLDPGF